nr:endosialidase [uncultured Mediterranean phage uvMED]
MANVIKHKRGTSDPTASDLVVGEVAIRTDVGKLFTKMDNGSVAEIAGGGSDIIINTLSSSSATGGGSATFNGSAYRFTLSQPPSVSAQQLLVSIAGVIQKPIAGTGQPSEGFSINGNDIILAAAPATGTDFFILTFKSLGVSEPADNSVTSAKIVDGAIVNADINASAAIAGTKISPDFGSQAITTTGTAATGALNVTGGITADDLRTDNSQTFFLTTANDFRFRSTGGSERMRIDSSGRLLIGTTTEGAGGADELTIATTGNTGLTIRSGTTGEGNIFFSDGTSSGDEYRGIIRYLHNGNLMQFFTDGTEKMRITSGGMVNINDTSNTAVKLYVTDTNPVIASFHHSDGGTNDQARISLGALSGNPPYNRGINLIAENNGAGHDFVINTSPSHSLSPTEKMRITSSGAVMINTTNSSSRTLNLRGTFGILSSAQNSVIDMGINDSGQASIAPYRSSGSTLELKTNTSGSGVSTRLLIDSSGNVGIGTTLASDSGSAGAGLKIEKYVQRNNVYAFPDGHYAASLGEVNNTQTKVWAAVDSHYARSSAVSAGLFLSAFHQDAGGSGCGSTIKNLKTGNALTFSTVTTGASIGSVAVETERMRIDSSGRVIIGSTSHIGGAQFVVMGGNINTYGVMAIGNKVANPTNNTTFANFRFNSGATGTRRGAEIALQTDGNWTDGSSHPSRMTFSTTGASATGASERMRIHSDGKVDVGGNSGLNSKFVVRDTGNDLFGVYMANEGHGTIATIKGGTSGSPAGTITYISFQRNDGNTRGSITNSGSTQLSFNTSSDYRLKENVVAISDGITRLKTLRPSRFNFKEEPNFTVDGFIAHEVTAVPESITGTKDEVDSDGKPIYQGIDQSKLVPLLVAALQEAIVRIEALEAG